MCTGLHKLKYHCNISCIGGVRENYFPQPQPLFGMMVNLLKKTKSLFTTMLYHSNLFPPFLQIYQEGMVQGSKESGSLDDLNRRACNAERIRDETLLKLETTESNMRRLEMT